MTDDVMEDATAGGGGSNSKLLIAALVAVGLVAFIVQNTDSTPVQWLVFDGSAPLWIVIAAAASAGAVLSELGGWMLRRRKRRC
ncbi:MAG: lipopolysaccharide assembly protein LapA domain-containing protein [Acidimicrobiales bacterium]|nr:lipopolysaccharide assembly protein LapA domain-containing protein [Acidimicrobiales bacterium]